MGKKEKVSIMEYLWLSLYYKSDNEIYTCPRKISWKVPHDFKNAIGIEITKEQPNKQLKKWGIIPKDD